MMEIQGAPRMVTLLLLTGLGACQGGGSDSAPVDAQGAHRSTARAVISTPDAPAAIGPYSQAVRVGETVYLAGQIALDPVSGEMVGGGIEGETRQVMENLGAVLRAAGLSFEHVVQSQVFLVELEEFGAMNAVYGEYFPHDPPVRATVQVARLPRDARVEILFVAVGPVPAG